MPRTESCSPFLFLYSYTSLILSSLRVSAESRTPPPCRVSHLVPSDLSIYLLRIAHEVITSTTHAQHLAQHFPQRAGTALAIFHVSDFTAHHVVVHSICGYNHRNQDHGCGLLCLTLFDCAGHAARRSVGGRQPECLRFEKSNHSIHYSGTNSESAEAICATSARCRSENTKKEWLADGQNSESAYAGVAFAAWHGIVHGIHADFVLQAGIIIIFCRLLHYPLSKLRQPRVIAEVIGGIILGPSVMMRIPGFKDAIFPTAAMPNLTLVANIGLILFLFLVGLEVNMSLFRQNWKVALSVGFAGMILPFGLGCGIAWGLYNQFRHDEGTVPISFGVYMLFIGTALSVRNTNCVSL